MEMLLTGRWIDAEEAARWGLVNRITRSRFATVATPYASQDQLEGARAFAEKREPVRRGK